MAPTAIQPVSELTTEGQKHIITRTAPSIIANGETTQISELDASKLIFNRNGNPRAVPEPDSPEVWAQNVYAPIKAHVKIPG